MYSIKRTLLITLQRSVNYYFTCKLIKVCCRKTQYIWVLNLQR